MPIGSAGENEFVAKNVKGPTLIGVVKSKGTWTNSAGRRQDYFNWDVGKRQPSSGKGAIYAGIFPYGAWRDYAREPLFYCIEWGKEP